jgi:hypothetical protein
MRALPRCTRIRASISPGTIGFGDVVDAAGLKPFDDVLGVAEPGHEYDWNVRERPVLLHLATSRKTVGAGHQCVHENDIGSDLFHDRKGVLAFARDENGHSSFFERVGQQSQRLG